MDLRKSELFYRLRSKLNPEYKKKDFSFYIHQISKMAPLSFEILGEEFFKKTLPFYFGEVVINDTNLIENIFYLPLYYKKYQSKHAIKDHILELLDYEFTKYQIQIDPEPIRNSLYDQTTHVYLHPMAQAIRHEYDILEFVKKFNKLANRDVVPPKSKTLLLMSKNPDTNEVVFLKGNINHAAIIDELHEGKVARKDLLHTLQTKYSSLAHREWVIALGDLKTNFFTLES